MISLIILSQVQVYFSRSVWNPDEANGDVYLDTVVVKYIHQAQKTIDMAIYSMWGSPAADIISDSLIAAKNRGVRVRIVAEADNTYSSDKRYYMSKLLNSGINIMFDDETDNNMGNWCDYNGGYLMHNKFVVIDSQITITGSANWSNAGTRINANNIVVIDNRDIALAYIEEFEEMWGSNTDTPDWNNCRFQTYKSNNTPHVFYLNTPQVDSIKVFFSPTDGTEEQIYRHIKWASQQIDLAINDFTLCSIRDTLKTKKDILHIVADSGTYYEDKPSINIRGLPVQSDTYCQNDPWNPPGDIYPDNLNNPGGLLHHKYAIFDRYVVLTGSVNWTYSGNHRNDENMIIIYSNDVANQFFQEFVARYVEAGGDESMLPVPVVEEPSEIQKVKLAIWGRRVIVNSPKNIEELLLYSTSGRLLRRTEKKELSIDRGGMYILKVITPEGAFTKVFIVH